MCIYSDFLVVCKFKRPSLASTQISQLTEPYARRGSQSLSTILSLSLTAARDEERTLKWRQRKTRLSLSLFVCQCSVSSESASRHDRYSGGLARVLVKLVGGRQTVWSLFCSLCVCCVRERVIQTKQNNKNTLPVSIENTCGTCT